MQPLRSHGQPAACVLARRSAVQQLLLHRDAHPRHLPNLRTRRCAARSPNRTDPRPVCLTCAGIPGNYVCEWCGVEGRTVPKWASALAARCATI